jgi:hypothetical protein
MISNRSASLLAVLLASPPVLAGAETIAADERLAIEGLIASVEQMTDASFVRNGTSYDAASAGKFLRGKWRRHEKEIRSAEQFIESVASVSSTTGTPYTIRFTDGRETPSADFLRARLAERRKVQP